MGEEEEGESEDEEKKHPPEQPLILVVNGEEGSPGQGLREGDKRERRGECESEERRVKRKSCEGGGIQSKSRGGEERRE